tara:strand:+ start:2133 stop:2567 length:435 start_codon:yes stop_codon:yes gene_type:complete
MVKKQIIITEELYNRVDLRKFQIKNPIIAKQTSIEWLKKIKNKNTQLFFYDLGFNKNPTKITPINNHINKTGTNPLRKQKENKIVFHDITNIYNQRKKGKTAECFGKNKPDIQTEQYIQARFLCNYVIIAHFYGYNKLFAYVID